VGIGFPELIIILVIVMLLFGAKKIPEIARSLGSGITEFKKAVTSKPESREESKEEPPEVKKG
jgi:sec-independent protein translocase protein TatA